MTISGLSGSWGVRRAELMLLIAALACHDQGPQAPTGLWLVKNSMSAARSDLGVVALNGSLYAVGGYYAVDAVGTVEAYDPVTNRWIAKAALPTPRLGLGVGVVDGVLYAVGGFVPFVGAVATLEAYDPVADTWTTKAPMPTARAYLAVGVVDGVLYAVGGYASISGGQTEVHTVEAYDPTSNSWTTKEPMPTARGMLAVGVVNGILYAIGGSSQQGVVEAYDPASDTWTEKAPIPILRAGFGVGVVNGVLYAVGGVGSPGATTGFKNTVEAFDPSTNKWTTKAPMPTARTELGVGVLDGRVYAIGGMAPIDSNSYGFVAKNEVFDPEGTN